MLLFVVLDAMVNKLQKLSDIILSSTLLLRVMTQVMERIAAEQPELVYIIGDSTDDDVFEEGRDSSCKGVDHHTAC